MRLPARRVEPTSPFATDRLRALGLAVLVAASAASPASATAASRKESRLGIRAVPDRIVLGGAGPQAVTLEITTTEAGGRAGLAGLRVDSTAGEVVGITPVGPGRFRATLTPPAQRFPQIAVVSVADVSGATAERSPEVESVVVAFSARLDLKGTSEPHARMRVEVGGHGFGPVTAAADGRFVIPIVVPPGEGWARAVATDALGNASRSRINLYLPAVQRVHAYVYPEVLVADGADAGWIWVTTVSPAGAPVEASVEARAARGTLVGSERAAPGSTRFAYRAPRDSGTGADEIVLSVPAWDAVTTIVLPLVAAPPARLRIATSPAPAPADGDTMTHVQVEARDAAGNLAAGHSVTLLVEGERLELGEASPGLYEANLPARRRAMRVEARAELLPQSRSCLRPRASIQGDRLVVVDRRSVPCLGELVHLDARGGVIARYPVEKGRERDGLHLPPLAAASMLVFADAAGGRHVVLDPRGAASSPLAATISEDASLVWRVPTAAELRFVVLERVSGSARLRLVGDGIDDVGARTRLDAKGGELEVLTSAADSLELRVRWSGPRVDVLATDRVTGVSAWLQLE